MRFDTSILSASLEKAMSLEGLVFFIGKFSLFAAVGFAYFMGENLSLNGLDLGEINSIETSEAATQDESKPLKAYDNIVERNIFGEKKTTIAATKSEPTANNTKLRLVATNISSGGNSFAIIENEQKKEQDVFEKNESIFQKATLVEVLPDKVKIERNGKVEVLVLEENTSGGGGVDSNGDGDEFSIPEDELEDALANLPKLLSQARAVPYFRNGKSIGMRLFAIRKASLYEKLGLKNGDIIESVNDSSISDPAQALKLFEKLKTERNISVKLERNGEKKSLDYSID